MSTKSSATVTLVKLQRETFEYFLKEANPINGLVIDKTAPDWPASIAATGLALARYPVSVEREFMSRSAAVERTLATLRFFWNSPQGSEPEATGFKGFYIVHEFPVIKYFFYLHVESEQTWIKSYFITTFSNTKARF